MKQLLILTSLLIISTQSFALNRESGGRMTALGYSKFKIEAAMNAITALELMITKISLLPNDQVKIEITSPNDNSCRALIYDIVNSASSVGGANFVASNPQRATCDL